MVRIAKNSPKIPMTIRSNQTTRLTLVRRATGRETLDGPRQLIEAGPDLQSYIVRNALDKSSGFFSRGV